MSLSTRILYRTLTVIALSLATSQTGSRAQPVSVNTITNNANMIGVFFNQPLTLPSATNPANYMVLANTGAVSVVSVDLQTNGQFVALNLATKIGEFFGVNVSNVVDVATNTINDSTIGYISDYGSRDVGTAGDPSPTGQVFTARSDTFDVTVGGSDIGGTNDHFHFIYQQAISNFDMAVMVSRLDAADPESKAGLMAREALIPGSRTVQTYFTPTDGSNEVVVAVRSILNGTTTDSGFQIGPRASASSNNWLRLTRTNNQFTAYYGTNGIDWEISGVTTQALAGTLFIGMAVAAHTTNGMATTASFTDFGIDSARPGDGVVPTLKASLSGTNLALAWQRTPRDFTVQVSTNLTDWAFLLAPIFETGTNGTGRSMLVPMDMWDGQLYVRLIRVLRVIPDPPILLSTGTLLSLSRDDANVMGAGLTVNSLCSNPNYPVNKDSAITQVGGPMPAVAGNTAKFTTVGTSATLNTVLKVRKVLVDSCNDNSAGLDSAGILSQVVLSSDPPIGFTTATFSFVAAAKSATQYPNLQVKVFITVTPQ